jgi:sugar phosphate isomerase/epimerase
MPAFDMGFVEIGVLNQDIPPQFKAKLGPKNVSELSLKRAAEIGYDGVEFNMWFPYSMLLGEADVTKIKDFAKNLGVEIATLSADWTWIYGAYHRKLAEWQICRTGLDCLKGDIKLASDLGAKAMLWHFGGARGTIDEVKAIFRDLAREAEKWRVRLGIESTIWTQMGLGGLDVLRTILDEINNEYFGVYVHGNQKDVETVGRKTVGFHFSSTAGIMFPGNYKSLFDAFKKYYDWYVILEPMSSYTSSYADFIKDSALESSKKAMTKILSENW